MNVIIGWILLVIAMIIFLIFAFGYDMDIEDKFVCIVCTVCTAAFTILIIVIVYLIAG